MNNYNSLQLKSAALIVMAFVISISLLLPSSVSAAKARPAWVIPETLNVRSGPGTERKLIGNLTRGTKVYVTAFANKWCWAKLPDGSWGWCAEWLLEFSGDKGRELSAEASSKPAAKAATSNPVPAWATANVNVRSGPGIGYKSYGTIDEGTKIHVVERRSGWCKVSTGNGFGWMTSDYLEYDPGKGRKLASTNGASSSSSSSGGTAKAYVQAEKLNLRKGPSTSAESVACVVRGQTVYVTAKQGDWAKVTVHGGNSGWMASKYLKYEDNSSAPAATAKSNSNSQPSAKGFVVGKAVNLRSGPGTSHDKVATVVQGQTVYITETEGDWCKVTVHGGNSGWIAKWLVKQADDTSSPKNAEEASSRVQPGRFKTMPGWVSEETINVRSGPDTNKDVKFSLERGTKVTVTELDGHWAKIKTSDGKVGWAAGWVISFVPPGQNVVAKEGGETVEVHVGWIARPKVNLRAAPSLDADRIGYATLSTRVIIIGQKGSWYKVAMDNGEVGWMSADLIDTRAQRLARRGMLDTDNSATSSGSLTMPGKVNFPSPTTEAIPSGDGSLGSKIIATAKSCLGERYVRGRAAPGSGFDCSGFVHYVMKQYGVTLPRTASSQILRGKPVARDELQVGDVVFFKNTYKQGISHVGIYMGGNSFIHAANNRRGVTTDSLDSSYYAPRYAGARRMY